MPAAAVPSAATAVPQVAVVAPGSRAASDAVAGVVMLDPRRQALTLLDEHWGARAMVQTDTGRQLMVERKLAVGLTSSVYQTRDVDSSQPFALKMVPLGPDQTEAVTTEVAFLRALDHPSIVKYHHHFVWALGPAQYLCIAEELCGQGSLKTAIQTLQASGEPLPAAALCSMVQQLASALAYLHARDLLHGDVRPETVLFTTARQVKLTGRCCHAGFFPTRVAELTITGGFRTHAPPEWRRSAMPPRSCPSSQAPDASYDMWGLGCVLGEMATVTLLQATGADAAGFPDELRAVHGGVFRPLVASLLETDPARRLTAEDVVQTMKAHAKGSRALWPGKFSRIKPKSSAVKVRRSSQTLQNGLQGLKGFLGDMHLSSAAAHLIAVSLPCPFPIFPPALGRD